MAYWPAKTIMLKVEIPRVECEQLTPTYGRFVVEPLERGYGHTLGSSISKILTSSICGVAVKWVRIDGFSRESSSIPYIEEKPIEVFLNIKKIIVKTACKTPFFMHLTKNEPGDIQAGDFEPYDENMEYEILNPDLHLATLKEGGHNFSIELCLETAKGYSPAELHKDIPDDYIPLDSLYSPVRKVDYQVNDTRVGQITDYDKLTLEVYTNGIITPNEAIDLSTDMLQEYLTPFIELSEDVFEGIMKPVVSKVEDEILGKDIEELNLSVRSFNCLRRYGITTVGDLAQKTEDEIMNLRNFGKKSLDEIKSKLASYNLFLKVNED